MAANHSQPIYEFKVFQFDKINYRSLTNCPKARSGHRIVSTECGDIYSFGGYNPNMETMDELDLLSDNEWNLTKPLFRELWKLSRYSRVWTKLRTTGDSPTELASHCMALIGHNLLVYGGTGVPFGETSSNKLYVCNLRTLHWNLINVSSDTHKPVEQYGQALKFDEQTQCIYICGGTTGFQYTIDVHMFDVRLMSWNHLWHKPPQYYGTFPLERYRHEIVVFNNRIHVIGGGTANNCYTLLKVPVFDIETREWSDVLTHSDANNGYPKKRRCHDCTQIRNEVFIIGGTNGKKIYDDLWKLDLISMQWTKINISMPRPVYFHSASVSPLGEMVIFGGVYNINHRERTNDMYSIWLNVAPLKEISWRAVLYYIEKRRTHESLLSVLTELRIPINYLKRLV